MNIIETILNIIYVYLTHSIQWPGAPLLGFGAALMTLSKTLLYWLNEYYCGFCQIGHNDTSTLIIYWILPNEWVRFCYRVLEYIIINLLSLGYGSLFRPWLFGFWGRASYNTSSLHQTRPRCTRRKWYKWREILIEINLLYAFPIDLCAKTGDMPIGLYHTNACLFLK